MSSVCTGVIDPVKILSSVIGFESNFHVYVSCLHIVRRSPRALSLSISLSIILDFYFLFRFAHTTSSTKNLLTFFLEKWPM